MTESSDDRRRAPRIPTKVPVKLRPTEGTTPYVMSAESINLSERGLYFQIDGGMKLGMTIDMTFTMPGDVTGGMPMKVRCVARIVRIEPAKPPDTRMGVGAHIERFETVVAEG